MMKKRVTKCLAYIMSVALLLGLLPLGGLAPSVSKAETLFDNAIMWEPYKLVTPQEGQVYKLTFSTDQTVVFRPGKYYRYNCYFTFYDSNGLTLEGAPDVFRADYMSAATKVTFKEGTYYLRVDSNEKNTPFWYTLSNPVSTMTENTVGTPLEGASSLQAMELYSQQESDYVYTFKTFQLSETKKFTLKFDKADYAILFDSHGLEVANESDLEPGTYFLRLAGTITNLYYVLTDPTQATAVSVSQQSASLSVGETLKLSYTLTPANCVDKVTWGSGDTSVATVDENGNVKAVGKGQCLIIATSGSKKSGSCTVTVTGSSESTTKDSSVTVGKVTSVRASARSIGRKKRVTISWNYVSNVTGYQVYYSSSRYGKYKKLGTVTYGTSLTKTFKNKKKHYFKVRAYSTSSGKTTYGSYSKVVKK
jgi:hypothetical protein